MQIKYSDQAISDLKDLLDRISEESPQCARKYLHKLRSTIELLSTFPNMGVTCASRGIADRCRVLVFEKYLIFYALEETSVYIRTILHTSQSISSEDVKI